MAYRQKGRLRARPTVGPMAERVPPLEIDLIVDYHTVGLTDGLLKWESRAIVCTVLHSHGPCVRMLAAFGHGTR